MLNRLLHFFIVSVTMTCGLAAAAQRTSWDIEPWTGNERAYLSLQSRIKSEFEATRTSAEAQRLYYSYERSGKDSSSDPQKVYQWGLAAYLSMSYHAGISSINVQQALSAVRRVPSPRTSTFARMRFLLEETQGNAYSPPFRRVGQRLLKRYPNDYPVKSYYLNTLNMDFPADRKLGLQYAQSLVQLRPKAYLSYVALGNTYERIWESDNFVLDPKRPGKKRFLGTLDQTNKDKAIIAYRKAQGMLSPTNRRYAVLESHINYMMMSSKNRFK